MTIDEYERTPWWRNYSKRLLSPADITCEICGKPHWRIAKRTGQKHVVGQKYCILRFNVHHKHYRHCYKETREDLMVLCLQCHEVGHKLADLALSRPEVYAEVYDLFCKKSGWSSEKKESYDIC